MRAFPSDDRVESRPDPRSAGATPMSARSATDPTFASRFECKYVVSSASLGAIRHFLSPFTRPDAYAAMRPGYSYPVSSLYLDSPELRLYSQTVAGEKERFKLRVRTYSDEPASRAFFEVKQKINNVVHKRRAGLSREQAAAVLDGRRQSFLDDLSRDRRSDLELFNYYVAEIGARPVVRVQYAREAYEGRGNEPVRVTIDTDLRHAVTLDGDLSHRDGRWRTTPFEGAILEIKFTERFPWWIQELVRFFGLNQRAVPKYVLSVDHMLLEGRASALAVGGLFLPPRGA